MGCQEKTPVRGPAKGHVQFSLFCRISSLGGAGPSNPGLFRLSCSQMPENGGTNVDSSLAQCQSTALCLHQLLLLDWRKLLCGKVGARYQIVLYIQLYLHWLPQQKGTDGQGKQQKVSV